MPMIMPTTVISMTVLKSIGTSAPLFDGVPADLEERSRWFDTKHDLSHRFEMRRTRLNLLRQGVDVAEPTFERGAEEDRIRPRRLVRVIRSRLGGLDAVCTGQPDARTCRNVDHRVVAHRFPDARQRLHQIGAR